MLISYTTPSQNVTKSMRNIQPQGAGCVHAFCVKGIGKVIHVHAMKSYRENGNRDALISRLHTNLSILLQHNSITQSRRVLLAPGFRFGQGGMHSGKWSACCDPPAFVAPGGKMLSVQVASTAFTFVHHMLSRRRKQ